MTTTQVYFTKPESLSTTQLNSIAKMFQKRADNLIENIKRLNLSESQIEEHRSMAKFYTDQAEKIASRRSK